MSARDDLRGKLEVSADDLTVVNDFLTADANPLIDPLLDLVERYGGVDEINRRADEAGELGNRMARLRTEGSPFVAGLEWLIEQRDAGAFVTLPEYRRSVLGDAADRTAFDEDHAVTLEISALQYFPWLIAEAEHAIEHRELMPGRYIRVRNMAEQTAPGEDVQAVAAAMQIIGASHVETLDTKGIDGSNVHLGGPDTIAGYFGGIGQPNDYPLRWADEYLRYLTEYGVRQVLNINSGTILVAMLLHKLGVRNEFKVSVFMGVDNPFAVLWLLMGARLFGAEHGTTGMAGLNLSNSVDADTIRASSAVRQAFGLEWDVRFEHHITEAYKSIVRQPYLRRDELLGVAPDVPNISAKHEGADPDVEATREHTSDIFDYFVPKQQLLDTGLMPALEQNYLDKHAAVCLTAEALTRAGIGVHAAALLHAPLEAGVGVHAA
jgi:hypothetical protein